MSVQKPPACKEFNDVTEDNPHFAAIAYAREKGIFSGDDDCRFRSNAIINRAEAVKVILTAFGKTILADTGNRLYLDTEAGAWYSPYLRTGMAFGIAGYPDGTFRSAQRVNKVEFLKMFFVISGRDIRVMLNEKPYPDVPINTNTLWYVKYVQEAKKYDLIATSRKVYLIPLRACSAATWLNYFIAIIGL